MEVTSPRRLTAKQKAEVVLALLRGEDAAGLARSCGVSWAQLFEWRDQFIEGGRAALRTRKDKLLKEKEARIRELERKVGQLTMECEILKKLEGMHQGRGNSRG
jgi:transposase-like protein